MAEIVYGPNKEQDWLETQSCKVLEKWLATYLSDGISAPIFIGTPDVPRNTIIYQYHAFSTDKEFKKRLETAVENLVNDWRIDVGSVQQLIELVALAGRLRITGTFARILALAKEERFKQVYEPGVDLHYHLLRTLIGFQMGFDTEMLVDRDIGDPRYSTMIGRAVWSRSQDGFIEILPLLPRIFEAHLRNPPMVDLHEFLREYLVRLGIQNFRNLFNSMIWKLTGDHFKRFLILLDEIGISAVPRNSTGSFIVEWHLDGNSKSVFVPSPFVRLYIYGAGDQGLPTRQRTEFPSPELHAGAPEHLKGILWIPECSDPAMQRFHDLAIEVQRYFDSNRSQKHVETGETILKELESVELLS